MKKIGGSASNQGWGFQMSAAEVIQAMASDGTDQALAADSISMVAQTWYHFLGVLNRGDNTLKLFRDGAEVASASASLVGSTLTTRETRVGQDSATTPLNLWLGKVARVMVWKKAAGNWTAADVEALKNSRFGLVLPNSLQLWWPLWGGSPEIDLSGLGFNGTVSGTTVVDGPPVGPILIEEDIWGSMEGFAAAPPPAAGVDPFRQVPARQAARALMPRGWES